MVANYDKNCNDLFILLNDFNNFTCDVNNFTCNFNNFIFGFNNDLLLSFANFFKLQIVS